MGALYSSPVEAKEEKQIKDYTVEDINRKLKEIEEMQQADKLRMTETLKLKVDMLNLKKEKEKSIDPSVKLDEPIIVTKTDL